jgi:hypothetical protein
VSGSYREGEDEGEKPVLRSRFGVFKLSRKRDIQGSPSPSSYPTRGEESKEKDEILTASKYEASG